MVAFVATQGKYPANLYSMGALRSRGYILDTSWWFLYFRYKPGKDAHFQNNL